MNETVNTDELAERLMAEYCDAHGSPVRFLDMGHRGIKVQACDGRILGEGRTHAEAWNDFAHLMNILLAQPIRRNR